MRIVTAIALPVIAVLACTTAYVGALHAQPIKALPSAPLPSSSPPPPPPIVKLARKAAPVALTPAARKIRIDAALTAAKLIPVGTTPQTLEMRVTPLAPKSNGAEITDAGPIFYSGAEPGEPDGEYVFGSGTGMISLPYVFMRFVTEPNKLYVIDCRLEPIPSMPKIRVSIGKASGGAAILEAEDGHVVYALQATSASTEIQLRVLPSPSNTTGRHGHFYGCDFGKVQ